MRASRLFDHVGLQFGRRLFRDVVTPRKPRRRALRVLFTLFGVALLAVLLVFGLVIGAAMLGFTVVSRLLRRRRTSDVRRDRALDGQYRVLRKPALGAGR